MQSEDSSRPSGVELTRLLRTQWTEIGPMGRTALIALVLSAVVAVVLGIAIPHEVQKFLRTSESRSLARVVDELASSDLIPLGQPVDMEAVDDAVHHRLLGRDTVRVKIWDRDGVVVYSDSQQLIGKQWPISGHLAAALAGDVISEPPDLDEPEEATERGLGDLREFYVPVEGDDGSVVAVFEVYELATHLETPVADIRRTVWISVGVGLAILTVFLLILLVNNARVITRRRRLAERLLGEPIGGREEEKENIVGALHDDIGQRLYRIHYGIEDCRSRVERGTPVSAELDRIGALVQEVDTTLRTELRSLLDEPGIDSDLTEAIEELVGETESESTLGVSFTVAGDCDLPATQRITLYRAAKEAVANVRRHAYATRVAVALERRGANVVLTVNDDGVGISGDAGLGLVTTKERLQSVGGGLEVRRLRDGGTGFRAWVPAPIKAAG